jgi:NADH:ubiquinone oxidoreductase subunit C
MRQRPERYEIVANLLSMQHLLRLRMVTTAPREDPTVASLVPIWPGANFAEREVYDMFGVTFEGHPDLTRILMPDEWEGHPLRKDFGVGSVPVQFKESHRVT